MSRLIHAVIVVLAAVLCSSGRVGSLVDAARFNPYDRLWQKAATVIASSENVPTDDWYAQGGSLSGFPWVWHNANGEFNKRTYDSVNSVVKVTSPHTAKSSSTTLLTNEWLRAMQSISYELSVIDRSRINELTTRGSVLQTQLVVEYEKAVGAITDAMRTDASKALAARNFTTFPVHQMHKVDYVVTYQLDFVWSCRSRDHKKPRNYHQFQRKMMQFTRDQMGLVHKSATNPSLLDVESIVPSEHMQRAFIDMFPCMPTAATVRTSLSGTFLQALVTQMFVFDAGFRFAAYPLTAGSVIRESIDLIQNPNEAESDVNTRVRDTNGNVRTMPAFNVHRDVAGIFDDMNSKTRRVRTRSATVSIGETMVASVRMAVRHDGSDFDVSLPQHAPYRSLMTPANAAKMVQKRGKVDPNYYQECVELELVNGYSIVPVGPATMQITHVNGTFNVTGGGWFDSAPLVGAVANRAEDKNAPLSARKTSGYHFAVSDFGSTYDYSKGGDFGMAGAYLVTSARSFSSQCRGRMFTDAQAASLRDAMKRAGDASFDGWTSGRGEVDEKEGGFAVRDWDDGGAELQYSLRDIQASLAATTTIDLDVAAVLLGKNDRGMSGVSGSFSPPPQLISSPVSTDAASVMATRVVWPGQDVNAFQSILRGKEVVDKHDGSGSPVKPGTKVETKIITITKHSGYKVSTVAVACAAAILLGIALGALVHRKCCGGRPSASQGLLSDTYRV